uniref:Uncharacterized protein n=1 Tax=Nelumbo nucifera TaxID=4432 RepID=A0A822ZQE3_NELNU|nr:TPA_asm: hypothetical protein HUJ06_002258 [Nelumbo nucifera]
MSFLLPNLSPSLILRTKSKEQLIHQISIPKSSSSPLFISASPLTKLEAPPVQSHQDNDTSSAHDKQKNDFYVNLGLAVRTLREDLPSLFSKDLNYDIYSKILFREISLDIFRVWQPSENVILIRWNLRGVPRVPWEAKGEFQGTSRYKLDRNGKIYEHKVDNLAFNFPQPLKPAASVLDLVTACPASPNPTFLWGPTDAYSSSWLEFYRAVRETLDNEGFLLGQDGLLTCSQLV